MEAYLEGEEITAEHLREVIRQATLDISITPVLCGSAFKNKGVQPLMDAIVDFLPSPLDVPAVDGHQARTATEVDAARPTTTRRSRPWPSRSPSTRTWASSPTSASTPARSRPAPTSTTPARTSASASAASCRCTPTTARTATRSTRASSPPPSASRSPAPATRSATPAKPIVLESMEFPEPVISVAIEPKTKADEEKLGDSLQRLAEEDPTFRVRTDEETGQTIIAGMGELHLEIIVDRLLREFKRRRQRRQAAGRLPRDHPQHGRQGRGPVRAPDRRPRPVRPRGHRAWSPTSRAAATSSRAGSSGGVDPARLHPLGRRGHPGGHEHRRARRLSRWSTSRSTLIDGSYHEVDSSDMAFKIAGSLAFKNAAQKAKPVLLEPMMAVEVVTPERVHGRRHGRPQLAARPHRRHGAARQRPGHQRHGAALARCSATPPTCARRPRAAPRTPCSSSTTPRCPRPSPQEIVAKVRGG